MVAVNQEMALGTTGDAEVPALRSNLVVPVPACASALPEPFTALEFPSTESKAGTEVVKKKMASAVEVYQDLAMSRKY